MKKSQRHLNKRDQEILSFFGRYRAGTSGMIHRKYFPDTSFENAARVIRRLESRELIEKVECGSELIYWMPTRKGLEVIGLEPLTPRPLTEQSLPKVLSIASYCIDHNLCRLTNKEFCDLYPELTRPGLRSSNYVLVESDQGHKLELLTVDRGGTPRKIKSRVRRLVAQRGGLPAFKSLMNSGRFQINVLTGTPEQQKKIASCIASQSFGTVRVITTLVAELGQILMLGE